MTVSAIRFRDGTLELLDQAALPAAEDWIRCDDASTVAAAIRRLAVRGAPAIGIAAAYGLAVALRGAPADRLRQRFEAAYAELLEARPTAVNLRWALERGRAAFERAQRDGPGAAAAALLEAATALHAEQREADERLAAHALELFEPGSRVLTHCNTGGLATGGSGTAGGAIVAAWAAGRVAEVWVDETRPLLQGARLTAWELQRAGVPHQVVVDASAASLMARGLVDLVIVGADRIAANGDVANKIGTYGLAVAAAHHRVPFYVAAPRSTLDPQTPDGDGIAIEERDPAEVTTVLGEPIAARGSHALNWAFDVTPAPLVRAMVTEAGLMRAPYAPAIAAALADAVPQVAASAR